MKKLIKSITCMVIIITALSILCNHYGGFTQSGEHYYEQQMHYLKDWFFVFVVIGFFIGFMPVYIHESIKAMKPHNTPAQSTQQAAQTQSAPGLYVGQTFTSEGSNCILKVKAVKPVTIELIMQGNNIMVFLYLDF